MLATVARPYARAVFSLAMSGKMLNPWLNSLKVMSRSFENDEIKALVSDPFVSMSELVSLFEGMIRVASVKSGNKKCTAPSETLTHIRHFLMILTQNDRLNIIPEVSRQLEEMEKDRKSLIDVHVNSAFELSKDQIKQISELLAFRLDKKINLQTGIDPDLIGGVCLRIGDQVFDASVRSKLEAMRLAVKL